MSHHLLQMWLGCFAHHHHHTGASFCCWSEEFRIPQIQKLWRRNGVQDDKGRRVQEQVEESCEEAGMAIGEE